MLHIFNRLKVTEHEDEDSKDFVDPRELNAHIYDENIFQNSPDDHNDESTLPPRPSDFNSYPLSAQYKSKIEEDIENPLEDIDIKVVKDPSQLHIESYEISDNNSPPKKNQKLLATYATVDLDQSKSKRRFTPGFFKKHRQNVD